MRRIPAVLVLLACFFAWPATGLFALLQTDSAAAAKTSAEDKLPPCCRRDGKHRCAMRQAASAAAVSRSNGPSLDAGGRCAYYPASTPAATLEKAQEGIAPEFVHVGATVPGAGESAWVADWRKRTPGFAVARHLRGPPVVPVNIAAL